MRPSSAFPRSLRALRLLLAAAVLPAALLPTTTHRGADAPPVLRTAPVATTTPMWAGSYNNGNLSAFESTPWNNQPSAPAVVRSPALEGGYAGRYVIPAGGNRCENVPRVRSFREGDNLWFSWAVRLGTDVPLRTSRWQVLDQWKNDGTGSPPLEFSLSNGQFRVEGGYGWPGNTTAISPKHASKVVGTARAGVWYRLKMHVIFSSNPKVGALGFWINGRKVISGWHLPGGTLYPRLTSYLKVGYYRDPAIATKGTVFQDRIKVGASEASVN